MEDIRKRVVGFVGLLWRRCAWLCAAVLVAFLPGLASAQTGPTFTIPSGGFDPAEVTALGATALTRWGEYLAVTLVIALAVGLAMMAIRAIMRVFSARRAHA